jgi:cystathionine beta-lyase
MKYDFDKPVERSGTDSVKYDLAGSIFGSNDLLPMWVADMDFEVPGFIREAIIRRAEHPVYGYTFRPGKFFESAAAWLYRRHQWNVSPEAISFSPGIVPALNMIVMAFTRPGDKVVVQPPVYFPFFSAVINHGRELVYNPLENQDGKYVIDFDHLEEQFRNGARMFFLCHPHNPVSRVWRREELVRLAELCTRYRVLVISDEIHSDILLFGNMHVPLASLGPEIADLVFTCIAPSKTFNLAGLYTSAVIILNPELKKGYERILDAVHVGGGSLFGQVAFEEAYSRGDEWLEQLLDYLEKNATRLETFIHEQIPGLIVSPLEATYLAWLDFSFLGLDDERLRRFITKDAGLALNDGPMFGPGGAQHQRLNFATTGLLLDKALARLAVAIKHMMRGS